MVIRNRLRFIAVVGASTAAFLFLDVLSVLIAGTTALQLDLTLELILLGLGAIGAVTAIAYVILTPRISLRASLGIGALAGGASVFLYLILRFITVDLLCTSCSTGYIAEFVYLLFLLSIWGVLAGIFLGAIAGFATYWWVRARQASSKE